VLIRMHQGSLLRNERRCREIVDRVGFRVVSAEEETSQITPTSNWYMEDNRSKVRGPLLLILHQISR
jgi:hypothetical protein